MSKPEDIPQDVWDAAAIKALEYVEWLIPQPDYVSDSEFVLTQVLARTILAAKAEEREACAQVADEHSGPFAEGSIFGAGETFAANKIAAAIRKRGGE